MSDDKREEKVRSIKLTGFGGYDCLVVEETSCPHPQTGEVTVKVKACGMNFADLYTRQGLYTFDGRKPPFVMGMECAGIVREVGEEVQDFKVGDRVVCWSFHYGMWSEVSKIPTTTCHHIPDSMSFEEAVAIPVSYVTAYLLLFDFGNLRRGQSVLVQAAAGGLGWAVTQLCKTVEDVVIFGTASAFKHEIIRENGITYAIDYHSTDFVQEIQSHAPTGVNIIVDSLSGSDFIRSQKVLKHMGRLIHVGISNMIGGEKRNLLRALKVWWQMKNINLLNLVKNNHAVCGFNMGTLTEYDPTRVKEVMGHLIQFYEKGKIKPRIDSVWSFDEVVKATKKMVNRENIGKLVLVPVKEKTDGDPTSQTVDSSVTILNPED
ncbi:synaptic vesicle membrane protein VAT-1 homolog [Tachypleus tridentatus]|uniref:synaptic vesicle membrane protein VAT-1 homolog n=1 Tax=Tachypleus tridentatus TaxID=6853 RepID=UPI003FD10AFF